MTSYEEMVANRDQRLIEEAARRLPGFFDSVGRILREQELAQKRYETFAVVDEFLRRRPALRDVRLIHRLDIDEWDGRQLKAGYLPARNVCAVVDGGWIMQYMLVRDPFNGRAHYMYLYMLKRDEWHRITPSFHKSAKLIPYSASNYASDNCHPELIIHALKKLCEEAAQCQGQTEVPATAS